MKSKSKTNDSFITNNEFRKKKVKTGKGNKEKAKRKEKEIHRYNPWRASG